MKKIDLGCKRFTPIHVFTSIFCFSSSVGWPIIGAIILCNFVSGFCQRHSYVHPAFPTTLYYCMHTKNILTEFSLTLINSNHHLRIVCYILQLIKTEFYKKQKYMCLFKLTSIVTFLIHLRSQAKIFMTIGENINAESILKPLGQRLKPKGSQYLIKIIT